MYIHIVEYVDCLNAISGVNWLERDPATFLIRGEDRKLVQAVVDGKANGDKALAKRLYDDSSGVSPRYRRRVALTAVALSKVVAICSISEDVDSRKRNAIQCVRHLCIGQTMVRTSAQHSARLHLLEANRRITHPELVSFAAPTLFVIGIYESTDGLASLARKHLREAIAASEHARLVTELSAVWIELSIKVKHVSLTKKRQLLVNRAMSLLAQTMRKPMTGLIAMAASRLATSVAQLTGNAKFGLRWLERAKNALISEQRFTPELQREHHEQRLFLFGMAGDFQQCVIEAGQVLKLCKEDSVQWFKAKYNLQKMQFESGLFEKAFETGTELLDVKRSSRQPLFDVDQTKVRTLYARVFSSKSGYTQRSLQLLRTDTVDKHVLRVLIAIRTGQPGPAVAAIESLRWYYKGHKPLAADRALSLLVRLLYTYAHKEFNYARCRELATFRRSEDELLETAPDLTDKTMIPSSVVWKGVIS